MCPKSTAANNFVDLNILISVARAREQMDRRLLKRQIGKVEEEMEEIRSQRDKYR